MKLLKFYKDECVPCQFVSNYLHDKNVEYTTYNVLEDFEETERFFIMSTPVTILLDSNNEEVDRVVGFDPDGLDRLIKDL